MNTEGVTQVQVGGGQLSVLSPSLARKASGSNLQPVVDVDVPDQLIPDEQLAALVESENVPAVRDHRGRAQGL